MTTEVVRYNREWLILLFEGTRCTRAVKLIPKVISRTAEVSCVDHFVAQEA